MVGVCGGAAQSSDYDIFVKRVGVHYYMIVYERQNSSPVAGGSWVRRAGGITNINNIVDDRS